MLFERYKKGDISSASPSPLPLPRAEAAPMPSPFPSSQAPKQDNSRASFNNTSPRLTLPNRPASVDEIRAVSNFPPQPPTEQPLACLFYFFHSQMSQHTSTPPDLDLVRRRRQAPDVPVHQLDTHLNRLQMHAGFSEHVKSIETFPVAVDPVVAALGRRRGGRSRNRMEQRFVTRSYDDKEGYFADYSAPLRPQLGAKSKNPNEDRDTVLLMQFRSKLSREQWMKSKEWRDFYDKVNSDEGGCRRMPHVRCARSLRGLMDVTDVLSA